MKANKAMHFVSHLRYGRYDPRKLAFKAIKIAEEELTERTIAIVREMFPEDHNIVDKFINELENER